MSTPEAGPAHKEPVELSQERQLDETRLFYGFILDRQPKDEEIYKNYYIIGGDVLEVSERIQRYIQTNETTAVKILTMAYGDRVPDNYLVACDPASDLFIVVQN